MTALIDVIKTENPIYEIRAMYISMHDKNAVSFVNSYFVFALFFINNMLFLWSHFPICMKMYHMKSASGLLRGLGVSATEVFCVIYQLVCRLSAWIVIGGRHMCHDCGQLQWNLSVTPTSMVKFIACDLFSNVL